MRRCPEGSNSVRRAKEYIQSKALNAAVENYISALKDKNKVDKAMISGAYPGLKIGDITTDNNNAGNW